MSSNLKRILMIVYHFPPTGGAGALRPLKTAKYLPRYGWMPIILTVRNPDWYYARDERLLKEISPEISIIRAFMFRSAWFYRLLNPLRIRSLDLILRRYVVHPDDQIGWLPHAVQAAKSIIESDNIAAIYSTSAPLTSHLVAYLIAKRFSIPWVADFRDEWFENPDLHLPTGIHKRLHYRLEELTVKNANYITTAAQAFSRYLAKHCPDEAKFETITMGFDPDDFDEVSGNHKQVKDRFTISFSGLFYGSFRPDNLLRAVNTLINENKIPKNKVCLRFIGANSKSDLEESDYYDICEFTGFLPHAEALHLADQSDALLLLLSKSRGKDVIPSKTFEYMALKKPVLAVVPPDGAVADIIRDTGIGVVADFENIDAIINAFLEMYQNWEKDILTLTPNPDKIEQYNYLNLTGRFASAFNKIVH